MDAAVESMLDIEQLRLSVNEQSIPSAIAQVHQWINVHGQALLKANQKLPFDYNESVELRKQHEKLELKCMKFLAFYAHMNLKTIPEDCEQMRQAMDIAIHKFSDKVKARRHVVVSFYTFYRHLDDLRKLLKAIAEEDHLHLPDVLEDVYEVIDKYHSSTNSCLRKFAHLKEEVQRVKSSLELVLNLNNENDIGPHVDPVKIQKVVKHVNDLLYQTELELVTCYESQCLLEMEIKIEAKMMFIEDEIARSLIWLQQIKQKFIDKYAKSIVGKATVENDTLQEENENLVKKLEFAHEYGCRLKEIYKALCQQFERGTDRGERSNAKFTELWNVADLISQEVADRLKIAGNLFHNLDTTLEKVEDLLMTLNKDLNGLEERETIFKRYQPAIADIHVQFNNIKKMEKILFEKLHYNLINQKITPQNSGYAEIIIIEDTVRMKIFTLLVKIKSLNKFFDNGETMIQTKIVSQNEQAPPDSDDSDNFDIGDIIKKYFAFLKTSTFNWKSRPLPMNLDQTRKAIEDHKKLFAQSDEYWKDIRNALSEFSDRSKKITENKSINELLLETENQRRKWNKKWNEHLISKLNPRLEFLLKLQKFSCDLEEDLSSLDDLVTRPNHNLPLVKELMEDLCKMKDNNKAEKLQELRKEDKQVHKSDFKNLISSLEEKLNSYNKRLDTFLELERMIQAIHEFLPQLSLFKSEWHNRVNMHRDNSVEMAELKDEAKQIHTRIDKFDIDRLRTVASSIYGSSKRVEWLIDELIVDFSVPKKQRVISGSHKVIEKKVQPVYQQESNQMSNFDNIDSNKKLLLVNAETDYPTKLNFMLESLPRIDFDQYDIQWYKDNEIIRPDQDPRIVIQCDSRSSTMNMNIENCQESDAGKYWCEFTSSSVGGRLRSSPVLLSVFSLKQSTVTPQFSDNTFAAINDSLSFKLKLEGFKYAPDTNLLFNKAIINVNHNSCPWTRISNNEMIEYINRSLSNKDNGPYEFQVSGRIVANTHLEIGKKPSFQFHEFSQNCLLGESLKIELPMTHSTNVSQKNISWKKNGSPISPDNLHYNTYINKSGDLVLEIPQFTEEYMGTYVCQVSNEFGSENVKLKLDLQETFIPNISIPVSSSVNDNIEANIGDSIMLNLSFTPGLNTEVVWTKDNQQLDKSDPRIKITTEHDSKSTLKITEAKVGDSGSYKATIKDTGQNKITNVEVKALSFAPIIQDYPQSVRTKENGSINIVCVINSLPFAQSINWSVKPADGSPLRNIMNNARYKMINKPFNNLSGHMQRVELFFDNVTISDSGDYNIRVENPVGWSTVSIPVFVSVSGDSQNKRSSPKFVKPLDEIIYARANENFKMKCKVSGNPVPIIKWLKNGKDLEESNRLKFLNVGDNHELLIKYLHTSDCGLYEASATNSQGFQISKCQLKVSDSVNIVDNISPIQEKIVPSLNPQTKQIPIDISNSNSPQRTQMIFSNSVVRSPPQFVTTFADEVVNEGDDVMLKCCLIGYPEPVVWWSYNTHFINNPRFELTRELDEYYLLLRNIQKSDSGRYSITAENSSGLATCSALIIVDNNQDRNRSIDRSKYPTNSRSMIRSSNPNMLKPSSNDNSRFMQASPHDWNEYYSRSNNSTPRPQSDLDHDIATTTTKTTKSYHYSGPSGVDLPGIGFIPKFKQSQSQSSSSSSSSKSQIGVAKFVSGNKNFIPVDKSPIFDDNDGDSSRFSVVESSDCDFAL